MRWDASWFCSSSFYCWCKIQALIRMVLLCFPVGGGQLLVICPWPHWQGWNLDDRLWKDCSHASPSHPGPSQPMGGGQQRGRVPLGPGQFYWHSDQHASREMKGILDLRNCHFLHRLSNCPLFFLYVENRWRLERMKWWNGLTGLNI